MSKKDICPLCKSYLISNDKSTKLTCPNSERGGCVFVDRRYGSSVIGPSFERRKKSHDDWKMRYRKEA